MKTIAKRIFAGVVTGAIAVTSVFTAVPASAFDFNLDEDALAFSLGMLDYVEEYGDDYISAITAYMKDKDITIDEIKGYIDSLGIDLNEMMGDIDISEEIKNLEKNGFSEEDIAAAAKILGIDPDKLGVSEAKATGGKISKMEFAEISDKEYTGKAIKPAVTVFDGSYALEKGTDFTVTYSSNKSVGKATITVKGKGLYTGSTKIYFDIVPTAVENATVKTSGATTKISWDKASGATKYQVYYSAESGKNFKKLGSVTGGKLTFTTKTLDTSTGYYFKVRAYKVVDGVKYYGAFSEVVANTAAVKAEQSAN